MSVIPQSLLLPVAGMVFLNNKVVVPASKKIATAVTTNTGILTKSEAEQQADMFDDFIAPVNNFLGDLADELLDIVTGGFYSVGMEFLGFKKDDVLLQSEQFQPQDIFEGVDTSGV